MVRVFSHPLSMADGAGSNPHMALLLIDETGLYDTIFSYRVNNKYEKLRPSDWSRVYDGLRDITNLEQGAVETTCSLRTIKDVLVQNPEDRFHAWMLACFVPWIEASKSRPQSSSGKKPPSAASLAAREGIKAENSYCKIIEEAVCSREEVLRLLDCLTESESTTTSPLKRKSSFDDRVVQGMAIRRWGLHWRSNVMFALLTDLYETANPATRARRFSKYATWLKKIDALGLLEVNQLKPLINGKDISKAFDGVRAGPWMQKAMGFAMEWQLRNPEATDPSRGIEEVIARRRELDLR